MTNTLHIQKVMVGPATLTAAIMFDDNACLYTRENIEACARIYNVLPHIAEHDCYDQSDKTFKDVMSNTSCAHLLEHIALELTTKIAPEVHVSAGRTWQDEQNDHLFYIQIACPDDVLGVSALSSAVFIYDWAFAQPTNPVPNIEGIVQGTRQLVDAACAQDGLVSSVPQAIGQRERVSLDEEID